jgi:hypothetical protein
MYNTSTLPSLLYGYETWEIRKEDKIRIMSGEMKFMRKKVKCT